MTTEASALHYYFQVDHHVRKFRLIFIEISKIFNEVADRVWKFRANLPIFFPEEVFMTQMLSMI